ncbi:MAG: hypothetical protein AB7I09_03525 [Planctomycetota bacterium]
MLFVASWGASASPVAAQALPTRGAVPDGYDVVDFGTWRWASPGGRIPPEPEFGDFFVRTVDRVRKALNAQQPRIPLVVVTASRSAFVETIRRYGADAPSDATLAVAFPLRDIMILDGERLRFGWLLEYPETVAHEVVHLVLGEGGAGVPRWYHEGLAQWLSGRRLDTRATNALAHLATRRELPPLSDLSRFMTSSHHMESVLYQQSLSVVEAIERLHGPQVHAQILAGLRAGLDFGAAYQAATGGSLATDEEEWLRHLAAQFSWLTLWVLEITLFRVLAVGVLVAFGVEAWRRRRRLRRMAESERDEEAGESGELP